jgi:hypothetical protein
MNSDQKTCKLLQQKENYQRGLTHGLYGFRVDQYEMSVHYKMGVRDGIAQAMATPHKTNLFN